MKTLDILDQIDSTSKRTEKEAILISHKGNITLKNVIRAALDPNITWWIASHPRIEANHNLMSLDDAINELETKLATRDITGYGAVIFYQHILTMLSDDDAEVLRRIVDRNLKCGIGVPTVNKIWPGLIPTYEFMLAETNPKKIVFPAYVQPKMDGIRCHVTRTKDDQIFFRTRNGNLITSLKSLSKELLTIINVNETFDGELVCVSDGTLSRQQSNGILNKAIRNTISDGEEKTIVFFVWDLVDPTSTIPYNRRLDFVVKRCEYHHSQRMVPIRSETVSSIEEATAIFYSQLGMGNEGIILKNIDSKWMPKRSFDWVKFKDTKTADLVVTQWIEGNGKYQGMLGSLLCESSDGLVKVNVGSGFSDEQRKFFTSNFIVGKVVEIRYNAKIKAKDQTISSLYLPRYISIREDKNQANTSSEIL